MLLSQLVAGFPISPPDADPLISGITDDSRRVGSGTVFVAVPGTSLDGHAYIAEAVVRGASAIVAERTGAIPLGIPVVRVPSSRSALALFASRFYGTTHLQVALIGFTGTFGKTSTSEILRVLLDARGEPTGLLGSLGARYRAFHDSGTGLTTPAPVELHRALRGLENAGATTIIMEVTSHALKLGRIDGLQFAGGLLAAIMPGEHTDFHRSYDDYVAAKRLFLTHLKRDAMLAFDADNLAARRLAHADSDAADRGRHRVIGFSIDGHEADVLIRDALLDSSGASFVMAGSALGTHQGVRMRSPLLGRGHLRNLALAVTYAAGSGMRPDEMRDVVSSLAPLRRRMERYEAAGRTILDDTAAHPDSLRATFEVAAQLPHSALAVVDAVRGGRGADINRRNALALADLCAIHGVESLILTSSVDCVGLPDVVTAAEIDATRQALVERGRRFVWHDALDDALRDAFSRTRSGDLIVLVGAQGMNDGKRIIDRL